MAIERCLVLDGSLGIYIPQQFYKQFVMSDWGLEMADYLELKDPYSEGYWDAWEELLERAEHVDADGRVWRLEQDGDLFAVTGEDSDSDGLVMP